MNNNHLVPGFRFRGCFIFLLLLFTSSDLAQQEYFFYRGREYGSERLFNPLSVILNGSFDIIQLGNYSRDITGIPYARGFTNVWHNIADPFTNIRAYGWRKFIRDEIIPIDFKKKNAQWWPNYQLHLIGGGMTFTALKEWYKIKKIPGAVYFAAGTTMAYHMLNEAVENGPYKGVNVDPIADIWVFDLGGMILFSFDNINRFFSSELNLADWSLQPSLSLQNFYLHNNGQYFSVKWYPFSQKPVGLFYYFGMNGLTGLSYKIDNEYTFSGGAGLRAKKNEMLDQSVHKQTVETVWTAGLFLDRQNSLLASVFLSDLSDYFLNFNLYPGILKIGGLDPGLWLAVSKKGGIAAGFNLFGLPNAAFDSFH